MTFTAPLALLLLFTLPVVWFWGRPRIAYRRGRDLASLILRTLILLCLILALAGVQVIRPADKLAVVFLVDQSDSMGGEARAAQFAYIDEALAGMQPEDEAAVIVFGGDALVERPMSRVRELAPFRSTPNTGNTDLEEAISLGLALFPPDAARRMVILSDGQPTVGNGEVAAQRAAAVGVEISYVPFNRAPAPEVSVRAVRAPSVVSAGQQFDITITVHAEAATPAVLTLFASGSILRRDTVNLRAGDNRYTVTLTAGADSGGGSDFSDFRAQIDPVVGTGAVDTYYQNNQLSTFTAIAGLPTVLLVTNDDTASDTLLQAMREVGLVVDTARSNTLPATQAGLAAYSAVILDNIPATALTIARMQALQAFVRDLGGGLVVIGGEEAYAPGGYFQTPLEETLPVNMQIRDQQRVPQLTLAYVIDRSGSMGAVGASGVENLELAKEAIIRSIEFLQPTDRAGVVSFDSEGYWVADVQPVLDRIGLQTLVATLSTGGGTDILAGYRLAADAMLDEGSERKHIILLTDGGSDAANLIELTGQLYAENNITTSVIAIGAGSAPFLQAMARAGGGNYHLVDLIEAIPTIFTQETVLATRSYIMEGDFIPVLTGNSPIMAGIDSAPALRGYVATSAKDSAQVILSGPAPFSDPVLASWQYGLGRAVAFTSDARARWAANWIPWEGFARFWSQTVRWTITEGISQNIEARVIMEGERARVVVDARDESGGFANGLALTTALVAPQDSEQLVLRQTAPGRYEAEFTPSSEGAYLLRVADVVTGARSSITGWVMSYSPEYNLGVTESRLPALADLAGGRSLAGLAAEVYDHSLLAQASSAPIAPLLLLIALVLLPFDIAVRRLLVTRSDLARLAARLRPAPLVVDSSERMAGLRDAKARAAAATRSETPPPISAMPPTAPPPLPTVPTTDAPPRPTSPPPLSNDDGSGNIAGRLLQRRRGREE